MLSIINRSSAIRCLLYGALTFGGYLAGLSKGKPTHYNAGKLVGCTKSAQMFNRNGMEFRCIINKKNWLMLEVKFGNRFKYLYLDNLNYGNYIFKNE